MRAFEHPSVESVETIDMKVELRRWAFADEQADAIDHHWEKLRAGNPHLFNGRVFLNFERALSGEDGWRKLSGVAAEVDFKAFLAWRDFGFPDAAARNCFAMAALRSADGAFVMGRMSETTANAGKIYFAAGTPDLSDVRDGGLDLAGSVARELAEELGESAGEVAFNSGWRVVFEGPRIACMKLVRSPLPAREIAARFAAFSAGEAHPEFCALHMAYGESDLVEDRMPDFLLRYLRDEFSRN